MIISGGEILRSHAEDPIFLDYCTWWFFINDDDRLGEIHDALANRGWFSIGIVACWTEASDG